jgi:hypothetical protein
VLLEPGNSGPDVHELHEQLLAVGVVLAPGELSATSFGASTGAAVRAFRRQSGLPAGDMLDLSTGRLMHAAAAFAGTGGRVALRPAVQEAAAAADTGQARELCMIAHPVTSGTSLQQVATRIKERWRRTTHSASFCSRTKTGGRLDLRSG